MEQVLATLCKAAGVQAAAIVSPEGCTTSALPANLNAEHFIQAVESLKSLADTINVLNRGQTVELLTLNMDKGALWIRRVGLYALLVLTSPSAKVAIISVAMNAACVQIRRMLGGDPNQSLLSAYASTSMPMTSGSFTAATASYTGNHSLTAFAHSSQVNNSNPAIAFPSNTSIKETAAAAAALLNHSVNSMTESIHIPSEKPTLDQIAARTGSFPIQPVLDAMHKNSENKLDQIAARTGMTSTATTSIHHSAHHDSHHEVLHFSGSSLDEIAARSIIPMDRNFEQSSPHHLDDIAAQFGSLKTPQSPQAKARLAASYQSQNLSASSVTSSVTSAVNNSVNSTLSNRTPVPVATQSVESISLQSIQSIDSSALLSVHESHQEAPEAPQAAHEPATNAHTQPPLPSLKAPTPVGPPKLPKPKIPSLPPHPSRSEANEESSSKSGLSLLSSGVRPLKSPTPLRPLRSTNVPLATRTDIGKRPPALTPAPSSEPPLGLDFVRQLISLANQHIGDDALSLIKNAFAHHHTSPQSVKASELNTILDGIDGELSPENRSKFRDAVQELLTQHGSGDPT